MVTRVQPETRSLPETSMLRSKPLPWRMSEQAATDSKRAVSFFLDNNRMICQSIVVMRYQLRPILVTSLALVLYVGLLSRLALWLDHRLALIWRLPRWADPLAGALLLAGVILLAWPLWSLFFESDREHAPLPTAPPTPLPLRKRFRNPLILGGWMLGAGLALLLRSLSLMASVGVIALLAVACVRGAAEPSVLTGLGERLRRFANVVPRWAIVLLVLIGTLAGFPAITRSVPPAHVTEPAILVQIRCKPGTAELWRDDFEQHLRPAIEEAVGRSDGYTGFQFLEPALPGQGFDFALLYTGTSFAGLDQPRIFPQYIALVDREGALRAIATAREMGQWEDHITVSLLHLSRTK